MLVLFCHFTAEHSLTSLLTTKSPHRFHSHFVETVFFLNGCTEHATYNQFERNGNSMDENDDGDMKGSAKRPAKASVLASPGLSDEKERRFAFKV
jgi:hypothetical protein